MYKEKIKQERFFENKLNVENCKKELKDDIDWEAKRVNVDSSKKRAVLQQMDYDGFRQMVLGANLIPMKKG